MTRLRDSLRFAACPIAVVQEKNARVVLASHLGRPKGVTESLRMAPVAARLSELLGKQVRLPECSRSTQRQAERDIS